jgi:hypothetical protein
MSSRRALVSSFAVAVLFALPLLSEILGAQRLVFRDTQITHWPWRRVATASLAAGEVPFINAAASGGQPLLANPNAVLLYPTFLLERVLPAAPAFNLHYLLHVLWAFFGARRLARALGLAEDAAFLSGVAFAFSGMMLSYGSAFMNSIAAASWLPWCAAAILMLERSRGLAETARAAAAAGLALGLQLLAGEPAISLLTGGFAGALALLRALASPRGERAGRLSTLAVGGAAAVALALAFAAPLLLPLREVFPLTYRGQHLYSERAFGAAAFTPERAIEWLLPRFGGDPGTLGGGANWLASIAGRNLVYIWAVTFGFVPLLLVASGALRREFWNRRSAALAAGGVLTLMLSFGFALPLYRLVYAVTLLRKLRYPIKFYLLTTLCVALLAGLAAETLARRRSPATATRWGIEAAVAAVLLLLLGAAWLLAAPGGALDRWAGPDAAAISDIPAAFLAVFRTAVRGDVLVGAVALLAAVLALRRGGREPGYLLGFITLFSALVFGLPLFVNAREKDLARPPALSARVAGTANPAGTADAGRLYVSPGLPRFEMSALPVDTPGTLPRSGKTARVILEELVAGTGSEFGARYLFENDPDGSYGFYNRLANEAADASTPEERDRLLRLYGGRWALAEEGEEHPLFRPTTGIGVAGRRLVLFEHPSPLAELRWAGRAWRRSSLSGTLELVRSERFAPESDVAFPGPRDEDPDTTRAVAPAQVAIERIGADSAAATVDAAAPGHLIFSRTFFPAWRARVDGAPAPLTVANARDLAVAVPAGRHKVEIAYDRAPFRRGVAIQAAAFLAALSVAVAAALRGRRPALPARGA